MGRAWHVLGEDKLIQVPLVSLKKEPLGRTSRGFGIILTRILKKQDWTAWISFMCLRNGRSDGLLCTRPLAFGFHKIRERSWVAEEILEPDKACAPVSYVWMPATRRGWSMVVACPCMCGLSLRMSEDLRLFHHTSSWFGVQFTTATTSPFVNEYQNQWECKLKRNAFGNSKCYVFSVGMYVLYQFAVIRVRIISIVECGRE
jgi:hypothetical protein